jgi:hypothetical protein
MIVEIVEFHQAGFRRLRFSFFADEHAPGAALVRLLPAQSRLRACRTQANPSCEGLVAQLVRARA